jgi:hypothetical protein
VQQAQKEKERKESAAIVKKMVQFNSLVVTPILDKIQVGDCEVGVPRGAGGLCSPAPGLVLRCLWGRLAHGARFNSGHLASGRRRLACSTCARLHLH